ncbi:MAG: Zn-ribbon domain-containing OB-fold protein [Planctomycetota bacterium]|nr:MAG: Zn-ribbon domain-containing OB-fold protein [Planctomycetota bacterium]
MFSAKIWRESPQRYRLEAAKCLGCGKVFFPPRLVCLGCRGREFEKRFLPWRGRVLTFTVIHTAPTPFVDMAPYCIAIVEVEEGVRLTCQLVDVDLEAVEIGMEVELEFRRIQSNQSDGVLCYGYKAVPGGGE